MSKRQDRATAVVGLTGVAGAGALRHHALADAYGERTRKPIKRPRLGAERRLLKVRAGRGKYLVGAGLGLLSAPAAATGINRMVSKADEHQRSFVGEGVRGARRAVTSRVRNAAERPPARLTAPNYAAGLGVAAGAGALTHHGLRHLPGGMRSATAGVAAAVAGASTLPLQSKLTQRASHGRYEVTPTGVRRRRTKPVRPSSKAGVQKRDAGANLSRGQRRAAITAAGPPIPVVGDIMQAAAAGRLAHPSNRRRAAVSQYASNQVGSAAGTTVGAVGAAALADRSKTFRRRATAANEHLDHLKRRVNIDPAKPSLGSRALAHQRTPRQVRVAALKVGASRAGRLVARNAPAAAIGGLALGAVGSQIGSQTAITRQLNRDDALRRHRNTQARHGSGKRVSKADATKPLTRKETTQLSRRKEHSAVMSVMSGTTGLGALGATLGERALRTRRPKLARRLGKIPVPALTIGGGIGGINAYTGAAIQHKEAKQQAAAVRKGFPGMPRAPRLVGTGRRAPSVRAGFVRQTRTATGIKVSSVRGGLSR